MTRQNADLLAFLILLPLFVYLVSARISRLDPSFWGTVTVRDDPARSERYTALLRASSRALVYLLAGLAAWALARLGARIAFLI